MFVLGIVLPPDPISKFHYMIVATFIEIQSNRTSSIWYYSRSYLTMNYSLHNYGKLTKP